MTVNEPPREIASASGDPEEVSSRQHFQQGSGNVPGKGQAGTSHTEQRHLSTRPGTGPRQVQPQDNERGCEGGTRRRQRISSVRLWILPSLEGCEDRDHGGPASAWGVPLTAVWEGGEAWKSPSQEERSGSELSRPQAGRRCRVLVRGRRSGARAPRFQSQCRQPQWGHFGHVT